jgi:4-amino-4-deoxy-L-arabinose transferase-like glycosyltransferase
MPEAIYPALFFTVASLVTNAYFLMGGLPLLVLKHDTGLDARFVRGFFNVYYKAAIVTAVGACVSYALWGRFTFALGAAALILVALLLRRSLLPAMQDLSKRLQGPDDHAIRSFRRMHLAALSLNFAQLVVVVWGITQLSL